MRNNIPSSARIGAKATRMLHKKQPRTSLKVPHEYQLVDIPGPTTFASSLNGLIFFHHTTESLLRGALTDVFLIRVGQFSQGCKNTRKTKGFLDFLKFKTSQDIKDFGCTEIISKATLDSHHAGIKPDCLTSKEFKIEIPLHIPPTAVTKDAEIHYAIVAKTILADGSTSFAGSPLQISTQPIVPFQFVVAPHTTFPESNVSMRVAFAEYKPGMASIPTTILLRGLHVPAGTNLTSTLGVSWVRNTETRWMTPREVRWEVEELATVVYGHSSRGDQSLFSSSTNRCSTRRIISKGKHHPQIRSPFNSSKDTSHEADLYFPLDITIPDHTNIASANELNVEGGTIFNTVAVSLSDSQARFAMCKEYRLRVYVEMGEDTFDKTTGSLVHRKAAQSVYATSCLLKPQLKTIGEYHDDIQLLPPTYDSATRH